MRVYEIAKEAGVTSADVLRVAEKAGVQITSAISPIESDEADTLRKALASEPKSGDVAAKREAKIRRAADLNAEFFAAQKAKLEEHLKIARDAADGKSVSLPALPKAETKATEATKATPAVATTSAAAATAAAKPTIRMAPGVKPKDRKSVV